MSAVELGDTYQPGGGYEPFPPRPPLTPLERVLLWAFYLWLGAILVCQAFFPGIPTQLAQAPLMLWFPFIWFFPARFRRGPDDWESRLTPWRRRVFQAIAVLIGGSYLVDLYLTWVHGFDGDRSLAILATWLAMGAVAALAWPRNPDSGMDMRPLWAICLALFPAVFLYILFNS